MRLVLCASAAVALMAAAAPPSAKLPKGPGQALVQAKCATCHGLPIVTGKRKSLVDWQTSLDTMADRGVQMSDAEYDTMAAYLAKHYGVKKK